VSTFVPVCQVADFRGRETILLVEDKFKIRYLISTALRARGYNVLEATGAAEALALYELDPVSIQLLLTDVIMPRGSGSELSKQLTTLRPTLKTLYVSGHPDWKLREEGVLEPGVAFIQKPFIDEDLARKVRETLDEKSSGP
jgi:two-component system cell cycle sensor histidine kinase/response regulator CckA